MAPRFKFTREEIIFAAVEVTRERGEEHLTARALAAELNSSPKPIFGLFQNMQEVREEVIRSAHALYQSYLDRGMAEDKYPPYKASGMAYILFAKEEKELFKLLFMRDRTGEAIEDHPEELQPLLELLMKNLGVDEEKARLLHLELWLFVHGIATMAATGYINWDTEFISAALTDAYQGLQHRHAGGNGHGSY